MSSKRIKFNDFLSATTTTSVGEDENDSKRDKGLFERLPEYVREYLNKQEVDAYEAEQNAIKKEIRQHLKQRAASDILYWARPPLPVLLGRLIKVISVNHATDSLDAILETLDSTHTTITIGYGWLEDQAKNGRPVKVSPHFFKEPADYVKAVKPYLYSVQDDMDYPFIYKFQIHQNRLQFEVKHIASI